MILVDTSIWIDHLHRTDIRLQALLDQEMILMHAYVMGEIALGSLPKRHFTLYGMLKMPQALIASPMEVLNFIDRHELIALGLGYVDVHLLASTMLTSETQLWSRDKRLHAAAQRLGIAAQISH